MAWTREKMNEIYRKAQQAAVTDGEFRKELLRDASAAIAKLAGEELPEDINVKVIERDPQYAATFVLPPMASGELDDGDLPRGVKGFCALDGCAADACAADGVIEFK